MQNPMPSITNAYRISTQEERHKELSQLTTQTESLAFYSDKRRFSDAKQTFKSTTNASKPQFAPTVATTNSSSKNTANWNNKKPGSQYFCTHCKIAGHSYERCFKVHGYPPNFKFKDKRVAVVSQSEDTVNPISVT